MKLPIEQLRVLDSINQITCGNCLDILKTFPDESIHCCITSPPYWALRDYGVEGQIGLEPSYQEYLDNLITIFDEVKRILRKDGTCWVVLGDTYSGGIVGTGGNCGRHIEKETNKYTKATKFKNGVKKNGFKDKSLLQIPSRFAIAMTDQGWILRNEIIWYKPNAMPSSVKDRFTVDFEKVFFFVKSKKYWFEQQIESNQTKYKESWGNFKRKKVVGAMADLPKSKEDFDKYRTQGRNKRCVWEIPTRPFKEAHFAVFPPALVEPMIKAGCPENGIVLDPFVGSGTVGEVAMKLNRRFIGIDLNPEYCEMAKKRVSKYNPLLSSG